MMWKRAVLIALVLLIGFSAGWFLRAQVAIDICLDNGGQWDPSGLCRGATKFDIT